MPSAPVTASDMLPAVAQGAIGIEIRAQDAETAKHIAPLNDAASAICVAAERAYLARLEGSCRTPIAGHATLDNGTLRLTGEILTPDGSSSLAASQTGKPEDAEALGRRVAEELIAGASPELRAILPCA